MALGQTKPSDRHKTERQREILQGWWSRLGIILHPVLTHERMPLSLQVYIILMVGEKDLKEGDRERRWGGGGGEQRGN